MIRLLARRAPVACLLAGLALAGPVWAADDFLEEERPVPAPPPRVPMQIMPPRVRIEMQQMQAQAGGVLPAAGEVRREPFLGVVTGPVSEQVRAQLDLPEGIGLAVEAVVEGGPAGLAGVKKFDILRGFDDQLVCTAEQLSTLAKGAGKGKQVSLTVIRGGKEQVVTVEIGEREVAVGGPAVMPAMPFAGPNLPGLPFDIEDLLGEAMIPALPGLGDDIRAQVQRQVQEAIQQAEAGGFGGNAQARVVQIFPGGAQNVNVVVVADERGSVEIRSADGKRTVTVKDRVGEEVHAGPLDTEADREQVPEAFRKMVREVEGRLGGGPQPGARRPAPGKPAADDI